LPTRLLVEERIADTFLERVVAEIRSLKMGDPMDETTDLGPVVDRRSQARSSRPSPRQGCRDGKLVLAGASRRRCPRAASSKRRCSATSNRQRARPERMLRPGALGDDLPRCRRGVEIANSTKFGLGAYIHSSDLTRMLKLVHRLNAGTIQVNGAPTARENAPFGGRGLSGFGREGGPRRHRRIHPRQERGDQPAVTFAHRR